jgi:hypothetical protein
MTRIVSTDGNVIAADFGKQKDIELKVTITTELLYRDGNVAVVSATCSLGDNVISRKHFMADIATGQIVHT